MQLLILRLFHRYWFWCPVMGQDGETFILSCTSEVQACDCLLISAGAQTVGDAASLRIPPPKIMLVKSVPIGLGR